MSERYGCLVWFSGIELYTMAVLPPGLAPPITHNLPPQLYLESNQLRRFLAAPTLALAFVLQLNIVGRGYWPAGSLFGWLMPILELLLGALNRDEVWPSDRRSDRVGQCSPGRNYALHKGN